MRAREPASFWRENVVVEVAETRYQMLEVFNIILLSGEGVTSFTKGNSANFSSEKWSNEAFLEVYILRIREKTLSQVSYT